MRIGSITVFCGLIFWLCAACYDDLGNYTVTQINDMEIDLKDIYEVKVPHTGADTLLIQPEVKQTLHEGGNGNLTYLWRIREDLKYNIYKHEKDLQIITSHDDHADIYLRFEVRDTILNIVSAKDVRVKKMKPFQYGWFILQNVNDQAVLGCVDGKEDQVVITRNINDITAGGIGTLSGKPLFLAANSFYSIPFDISGQLIPRLDICTDQMGVRYEVAKMQKLYEYSDLLLYKRIIGNQNYHIQYAQFIGGEIIIENDVFWFANGASNGHSVYYPVKIEGADSMDYQASCAYSYNYDQYAVVFDKKYHRFLWYPHSEQDAANAYWTDYYIRNGKEERYTINGSTNRFRLRPVERNAHDSENLFDPQNIGNKVVFYMGGAADSKLISCAVEPGGRTLSVYEMSFKGLNRASEAVCSGYFTYQLPEDPQECHFASSANFKRMLFFVAGNKLYRLDLNGTSGVETEIFTLDKDAGARFTALKFEHEQSTTYSPVYDDKGTIKDWIDDRMTARLGIVVKHGDGTWGMISVSLDDNGNVDGNWEFSKDPNGLPFDPIVDIAYVSQSKE